MSSIIHTEITPRDIKLRKYESEAFSMTHQYLICPHQNLPFGAYIFRKNLLWHISERGAPCVSKWRMRRKDDNLLTPLIVAWLYSVAEFYVVMVAAILNKPWGMHLFCIKPFHSDNSLWAADKYTILRLESCTDEHIGHESPCDTLSVVLFEKQSSSLESRV